MHHYDFQQKFHAVYKRALASYRKGGKTAATLLSAADTAFLVSIGGRAQDMFDYAEDSVNYEEPDFETALLIEAVRRDYFLTIQKGKPSSIVLEEAGLPAKTDSVRGIEWLPRIIPKAKAKLRGELPASLMYCCGGDRRFFKAHDIHPAEFLRVVWAYDRKEERIVDWVEARSRAAGQGR
jgi:hypothetical protein